MSDTCEINPGSAQESILVTTDSCENFEQMSSSLEEIKNASSINFKEEQAPLDSSNADNYEDVGGSTTPVNGNDEDIVNSKDWLDRKKHVFVLSSAGKPIYSRYGNEDKLAWLFGVMQTLVSFVQAGDDTIKSIHAGDTLFVFLTKKPLILVAVSKTEESVNQLTTQLK